jgi:hypothetical protein
MKKKAIVAKTPSEIPEVCAFLEAVDALDTFKAKHADVFEDLAHLIDRYNTTLEQADKVTRAQSVKCGPFDAYQVTVKYNAKALHDAVGRELFLTVGGIIGDAVTYDLDKGRFEAAVTTPNSKITDEVLNAVRKESVSYHVPPKLVLP